MTSFFGDSGGGIGYLGLPGWSIEIDNYYNGHDPTPEDHLTFSFDGNIYSPEAWVVLPDLEDEIGIKCELSFKLLMSL